MGADENLPTIMHVSRVYCIHGLLHQTWSDRCYRKKLRRDRPRRNVLESGSYLTSVRVVTIIIHPLNLQLTRDRPRRCGSLIKIIRNCQSRQEVGPRLYDTLSPQNEEKKNPGFIQSTTVTPVSKYF